MEERIICADCGKEITDNSYVELPNDDYICEDCYDENYCKCDCCGDIIRVEDSRKTYNGDVVCEYCAENDYCVCEKCGELIPNDDICYVDDIYICEECLKPSLTPIDK